MRKNRRGETKKLDFEQLQHLERRMMMLLLQSSRYNVERANSSKSKRSEKKDTSSKVLLNVNGRFTVIPIRHYSSYRQLIESNSDNFKQPGSRFFLLLSVPTEGTTNFPPF